MNQFDVISIMCKINTVHLLIVRSVVDSGKINWRNKMKADYALSQFKQFLLSSAVLGIMGVSIIAVQTEVSLKA